jgi:hypothetical protein
MIPGGRVALVAITRAGTTVSVSVFVAVVGALSVTLIVKLKEPAVVGAPLSRPAEFMFNPPGSVLPASSVQTKGGVPSVALKVWM